MHENIFKPLGMTSTSFYLDKHPDMRKRFVAVCQRTDDGGLMELPGLIYPDPPVAENGGHGLYASPSDYVKVLADIISDIAQGCWKIWSVCHERVVSLELLEVLES